MKTRAVESQRAVNRRTWTLVGPDGKAYESAIPGTLGGHRKGRLYGRMDCRAAARALARGGYAANRVFFFNEADAKAAGYRPCAVCMPVQYAQWKTAHTKTVRGR